MYDLFGSFSEYYYFILALQALCVFHSYRKGNQQKWIWIIVFLPLVGSLVYIFTEIVKRNHVSDIQEKAVAFVNPGGRIKNLEKNFKFTSTFTNRVALADAYLESGMFEKAIELYEPALTGIFHDNEHILKQLIHAYYQLDRMDEVVRTGLKITNAMNFSKSHTNLLYALALEKTGNTSLVEKQYQAMNHRFSNYEARYNYGCFLLRQSRIEEAGLIFFDIVEESERMSRREKGGVTLWIDKSKEEISKLVK
ncbi:hypothetical protein CNR22_05775 [Sphingobacteriaceae bacterium]|nr:hypothetical protein CNR22_05775 [Sphingobacteriaceae bacterium]